MVLLQCIIHETDTVTETCSLEIAVKKSLKITREEFLHSRSSHRRCSVRKSVLRNFAKFTGKHQPQSLYFNKVAACNFIKIETQAQLFPCEFCETSKNTFFTEHAWATASIISKNQL